MKRRGLFACNFRHPVCEVSAGEGAISGK